jgi:hypothetical protein
MFIRSHLHTSHIQLQIYAWHDPHAIIRFLRDRDTLLSLEADPYRDGFLLNSWIEGQALKELPFLEVPLRELQFIRIRYLSTTQRLDLEFCHTGSSSSVTHRICVRDFKFNTIIAVGLQMDIMDLTEHQPQVPALTEFTHDCTQLDSFLELTLHLSEHPGHTAKFVRLLKEAGVKQSKLRTHDRIKIEGTLEKLIHMNSILDTKGDQMGSESRVYLENASGRWEFFSDGRLRMPEDTPGFWFIGQERLLLFDENGGLSQELPTTLSNLTYSQSLPSMLLERETQTRMIVLLITCHARLGMAKRACVTWLRDLHRLGILCLIVVGHKQGTPGKETHLQGNLLYVNAPDSYEALPKKISAAFQYCIETYSFEYLYKVDDDTLVNPLRLASLRLDGHDYVGKGNTVDHTFNRYWHRGKCKDNRINTIPYPTARIRPGIRYAKGEAGYILSKKAVMALIPYWAYIASDLYEDKAIGEALCMAGIKLHELASYTTKLYETFPRDRLLDQYIVIVDGGRHIDALWPGHFSTRLEGDHS